MSELFLQVIRMSLSATALAAGVMAVRLFLKNTPKWVRVLLWALVGLRLVCPLSFQSSLSLIPEEVSSGALVEEWSDTYVGDVEIYHDNRAEYTAAIDAGRIPVSAGEGGFYVVTAPDGLSEPETVENTWIPILSWVWVAGMAAMGLYTLVSYLSLLRRVKTAVSGGRNVYLCEYVSTPFVLGLFSPKIYLPYGLCEADVRHVIAHERTHIARKDHWWKPLGFALLSIHWFNPVMWLSYVLLCRDIELACDEKVVKALNPRQRASYSQALLNCSVRHVSIAACPLAFGESGVRQRVRHVLHYQKPGFWALVLALIACVVLSLCFLTDPAREPEPIAGKTYDVTEHVYDDPRFSFTWWLKENNPYVTVTEEGHLLVKFGTEDFRDWVDAGLLENVELTAENFDRLFYEYAPSSLRRGNEQAWRALYQAENEDGSQVSWLYYLLRQKNGELYFACGYYDPEGETDPYSDDSMIRWLLKLEETEATDWGLVMKAENPSSTGLTVMFNRVNPHSGNLMYGEDFALQRRANGRWEDVEKLPGEHPVITVGYGIPAGQPARWEVHWEDVYGVLPDGNYRIAKEITKSDVPGEWESMTFYTEFTVRTLPSLIFDSKKSSLTADFLNGIGYNFFPEEKEQYLQLLAGLKAGDFSDSLSVSEACATILLTQEGRELLALTDRETVEFYDNSKLLGAVRSEALNEFINEILRKSGSYETYNHLPLEEIPQRYSIEEAIIDKCVIEIDRDARYNQEVWEEFLAAVARGEPAEVRLLKEYNLGDPAQYDPAYYASVKDDYPMRTIQDLIYDGTDFTLRWFEEGEESLRKYLYLRHFTGTQGRYDYSRYILTDHPTATYDELWRSLASSQFGAAIPHSNVYSDLTYIPQRPEVSGLVRAELCLNGEVLVAIDEPTWLEGIQELFAAAEETYEPKTVNFGPELKLTQEDGSILTVSLSLDVDLCLIDGQYYDFGPGYTDDGSYNALPDLLALLGLDQYPQEVWLAYPRFFGITEQGDIPAELAAIHAAVENIDYTALMATMSGMDWAKYDAHYGAAKTLDAMEMMYDAIAYGGVLTQEELNRFFTCLFPVSGANLDGAYAARAAAILEDLYELDSLAFAQAVLAQEEDLQQFLLELFDGSQRMNPEEARAMLESIVSH